MKRLDKFIYIPCECRTPYHFVCVDADPDVPDELNISVVSMRNGSFWRRVQSAMKHVFGREDLVFGDVLVKTARWVDAINDQD